MAGDEPRGARDDRGVARPGVRRTGRAAAIGALTAALLVGSALPAAAAWKTLRWTHPDPASVASFRVHIGTRSRHYDRVVEVSKPAADADGVFVYLVDLGDDPAVYVALTAVGPEGLESALSNERSFDQSPDAEPLGQPGRPTLIGP